MSVQDFPFLGILGSLGQTIQSGTVSSVAADGSAMSGVTFPTAYTATPQINLTPQITLETGDTYNVVLVNPTTVGFSVWCGGGPLSSTISVDWTSVGTA